MTVKLKQDRTRKGGFRGSLNAQDWPAEKQRLPPITLATSNINNAKISAEIAAGCLAGVNPAAWQHLQLAISELASALEDLNR